MTVTAVVEKRVWIAVDVGPSPALHLRFRLEWRDDEPHLTLDCAELSLTDRLLGEGDGALAAVRDLQAALAELAHHLAPEPSSVAAPGERERSDRYTHSRVPVPGPTAAVETAPAQPLEMTPEQLQQLQTRWLRARSATSNGVDTDAVEHLTPV